MAKYVGQRVKRTEDPRLIKGLAHYVDDIRLAGHAACRFRALGLRARAHHRHRHQRGAERAGRRRCLHRQRRRRKIGPVPCASALPGLKVPDYRVLATRTRSTLSAIRSPPSSPRDTLCRARCRRSVSWLITKTCLPSSMSKKLRKAARSFMKSFGDNIAYKLTSGEGDIDAALAAADHVLKQRIVHQRLAPIAMEPRGVLARYFPGEEELTVWSSTQIPHLLRTQVALMIGIPENKLRVITPEVGGGFGSKLNVYAEEALLGWISMQLGKPVKWIEDAARKHSGDDSRTRPGRLCRNRLQERRHDYRSALQRLCRPRRLSSTAHARDSHADGLDAFRCLQDSRDSDQRHRRASQTRCPPMLIAAPAGRKQLMSSNARWISSPPNWASIRLKCDARISRAPTSFPFTPPPVSTTTAATTKRRSTKRRDYRLRKLREEQKKARDEGRLIGIGISTYVEICALGPSQAMPAGGWESATVRIEPTGKVTVLTGASPHGQGQETSFAQIAADELGVDLNDVTVIHGDTGSGSIRHRHVWQPRDGSRRHGGAHRDSEAERESAQDRRAHAARPMLERLSFEGGRYSLCSRRSRNRSFRTCRAGW